MYICIYVYDINIYLHVYSPYKNGNIQNESDLILCRVNTNTDLLSATSYTSFFMCLNLYTCFPPSCVRTYARLIYNPWDIIYNMEIWARPTLIVLVQGSSWYTKVRATLTDLWPPNFYENSNTKLTTDIVHTEALQERSRTKGNREVSPVHRMDRRVYSLYDKPIRITRKES